MLSSVCRVSCSGAKLTGIRVNSMEPVHCVCCFARPPTSALHAADRPVIALEAVRGRLPSAASPASNMQLQSALQHAAYTADAVQPVPLDRWDANWLLLEAGSRWAVPHTNSRKLLGC